MILIVNKLAIVLTGDEDDARARVGDNDDGFISVFRDVRDEK